LGALAAALLVFGAIRPVAADLIFTAPPRESAEVAEAVYGPLVDYLGRITGERVVYERPASWVSYFDSVVQNRAQLYFSEAHSVGYHVSRHGHRILARGPDEKWVLVGHKDADFRLAGRAACLLPPPDTGFLLFMRNPAFDNPAHAPHVVPVDLYEDAFTGLINEQCQYAAVTQEFYDLFPELYRQDLVTHELAVVPGQAFTVSRKVDDATAETIRRALLSPQGQTALEALRNRLLNGAMLAPVESPAPYLGEASLLLEEYLQPINRAD